MNPFLAAAQVLVAHFDCKLLLEVPKQLWENPIYSRRIVAIHLENNFLTSLPEQLATLRTLRLLSVARNRLTAVPEWLRELPDLDTLSVGSNRIAAMSPGIGGLPRLAHLNLFDNRLRRVPVALGRCLQLHTLVLGRNPWSVYAPDETLAEHVGLPPALLENMRGMTARSFCQSVCEFLRSRVWPPPPPPPASESVHPGASEPVAPPARSQLGNQRCGRNDTEVYPPAVVVARWISTTRVP